MTDVMTLNDLNDAENEWMVWTVGEVRISKCWIHGHSIVRAMAITKYKCIAELVV